MTCLHSPVHLTYLTHSSDPLQYIHLITPRFFSDLIFYRLLELPVVITVSYTVFPQSYEQLQASYFWAKAFNPIFSGSYGELFDDDVGPTCWVSSVAQTPVLCSFQWLLVSNSLFCFVSE
jgi:hypothetical protein